MTLQGLKREMNRLKKIHENGRLSAADHEKIRVMVNREVAKKITRRLDIVENMVVEKLNDLIN